MPQRNEQSPAKEKITARPNQKNEAEPQINYSAQSSRLCCFRHARKMRTPTLRPPGRNLERSWLKRFRFHGSSDSNNLVQERVVARHPTSG